MLRGLARLSTVAVVFAGTFLTATQIQPTRAAPDKAQGMALMGAYVNYSNGSLARASGVTASQRVSAGVYVLTFDRTVDDCFITANVYDAGVGVGYAVVWRQSGNGLPSGNSATILTYNTGGARADHQFHVIAFCPR